MAAILRVNPDALRSAAATQGEVAAAVSGLHLGASISAARAAVIATDLSAHAERLTRAATEYRSTEQEQAARLQVPDELQEHGMTAQHRGAGILPDFVDPELFRRATTGHHH